LYPSSQPGRLYVVDTDCETKGIPYGDSFSVATKFCLTRVTKHSCRLHITSQIKYRKNVMAIIRNMIYKAVIAGSVSNFSILSELLQEQCDISPDELDVGNRDSRLLKSASQDIHSMTTRRQVSNNDFLNQVSEGSPKRKAKSQRNVMCSNETGQSSTEVRYLKQKTMRPANFIVPLTLLFLFLMVVNGALIFMLLEIDIPNNSHGATRLTRNLSNMKDCSTLLKCTSSTSHQSKMHVTHLVKVYDTLAATTDLMRLIQRSLEQLLKEHIALTTAGRGSANALKVAQSFHQSNV